VKLDALKGQQDISYAEDQRTRKAIILLMVAVALLLIAVVLLLLANRRLRAKCSAKQQPIVQDIYILPSISSGCTCNNETKLLP
jgi:hypothetical protein